MRGCNARLFDGDLPDCLITLQRKGSTLGYFSPSRFIAGDGEHTDEIALNPKHFRDRGVLEVLCTLVHEQAHLWQHHFGKPSRGGYHNRQWAKKMLSVGLVPSDTGKPGGRMTGHHMADYPAEDGPFTRAAAELIATGFRITWSDAAGAKEGIPPTLGGKRTKFICTSCGFAVWTKPSGRTCCGFCNPSIATMEPVS